VSAELHFLVVNDSPVMRQVVVCLLKELGYIKISEASEGAMALRCFKAAKAVGAPINFVITDYSMPVMDGLTLIRRIRGNKELSHLPILVVSPEATRENILAAIEAGTDDYIVKPFKAVALQRKLDKIFAKVLSDSKRAGNADFASFVRSASERALRETAAAHQYVNLFRLGIFKNGPKSWKH
jgi:two-component system chemotaxis response regulator CheY